MKPSPSRLIVFLCLSGCGQLQPKNSTELALTPSSLTLNSSAGLDPGISCDIANTSGKIRITVIANAKKLYHYEIGGGGTIDAMADAKNHSFLASHTSFNHTDRVFGLVNYSSGDQSFPQGTFHGPVKSKAAPTTALNARYNVNQAGTRENHMSPIFAVDTDRANCAVEIWTNLESQWFTSLQKKMQGKYSMLTRYQVQGSGEISVRKIVYWGSLHSDGALFEGQPMVGELDHLDDYWFEAWNALKFSAFRTVSVGLDASGNPKDGSTHVIPPRASSMPSVHETAGYVVAYDPKRPRLGPGFGVAFGTQDPSCTGHCGPPNSYSVYLGAAGGSVVAAIDPVMTGTLYVDSIVDQSFYLVPLVHGLYDGLQAKLQTMADSLQPISIYSQVADSSLPTAELQAATARLKAQFRGDGGVKPVAFSNKLGSLIR